MCVFFYWGRKFKGMRVVSLGRKVPRWLEAFGRVCSSPTGSGPPGSPVVSLTGGGRAGQAGCFLGFHLSGREWGGGGPPNASS